MRLRRGVDKPGDDTGPYAGQYVESIEQGKPDRFDNSSDKEVATAGSPNVLGKAG